MLDLWTRWVQFHELYMQSEPTEAPIIPLQKLVPFLINRINSGVSLKLINNNTAALRIADYLYDDSEKVLILLVQYSDQNVTDPVFGNLQTGKLRKESKLAGEGVAVSAHVAINIEPHDENKQIYKLILEEIPGLGRSNLSPFIKSEFKEAAAKNFEYEDKLDNKKIKNYKPSAEILAKPSKTFIDETKEGITLQSAELVQMKRKVNSFDEEGFYTETSRSVKFAFVKSKPDSILDVLQNLISKGKKNNFDNVKIRYKQKSGKSKTATMGLEVSDIVDTLVTETAAIKATEVLSQCSDKIVKSIADEMVKLLKV